MPRTSLSKRVFGVGLTIALTASLFGGAVAAQDAEKDTRVVMLSTQLQPLTEQRKMTDSILAGFDEGADPRYEVWFQPVENTGQFINRVQVDATTGDGANDVLGGLHGEFAALANDGLLMDLSELAAELDIAPNLLELGKLGTDEQLYIPWMTATYIMAAHNDAMQYLPEGADINALSWDEVAAWGAAIEEGTGERLLGIPVGDKALHHRLFQGYLYPSFTGGVNETFATPEAVEMWEWLRDMWQYVNPQANTFSFMQDHLQSGEALVAWDHTARLIEAIRSDPENYTAFPAPAGPAGRGFMPVVLGLAVPNTAGNLEGAKDLIRHLVDPATQGITLAEVGNFPVAAGEVPADVDAAVQNQLDAVAAMLNSEDALPALLPVGLGAEGGEYSQVFKDAFKAIILDGGDPASVLTELAPRLQGTFDRSGAPCWTPDEASDGPCQVGSTVSE